MAYLDKLSLVMISFIRPSAITKSPVPTDRAPELTGSDNDKSLILGRLQVFSNLLHITERSNLRWILENYRKSCDAGCAKSHSTQVRMGHTHSVSRTN